MRNLTLVIPAKNESESLPLVMEELKSYECKKLVILSKGDELTHDSIKNYECSIEYQTKSGYGNAIIEGINKWNLNTYQSFMPMDQLIQKIIYLIII